MGSTLPFPRVVSAEEQFIRLRSSDARSRLAFRIGCRQGKLDTDVGLFMLSHQTQISVFFSRRMIRAIVAL